jgi:hypothetical protein
MVLFIKPFESTTIQIKKNSNTALKSGLNSDFIGDFANIQRLDLSIAVINRVCFIILQLQRVTPIHHPLIHIQLNKDS